MPLPRTPSIARWDSLEKFPIPPQVHIPNSEDPFLVQGTTQWGTSLCLEWGHTAQLLGNGHLTSLTHLHPSHSLLFEAPSQSNHGFTSLLFLVGKVLNILKSWAESVLSPFKLTPLCRWDKSEMAATAKPAPRGKSGPWERVCTEERVPLLVVNFSFSWRPFESLSLTHGCLNKFN